MSFSLVGSLGAAVQGASGGAVTTLAYGQTPTANNLLVLWVEGVSTTSADDILPAAPTGWTLVKQVAAAGNCTSSIFFKKASGGDSAPTLAAQTGTLLSGQLGEFAWSVGGVNFVLDESATAVGVAGTTITATAGAADVASGNLLLAAACAEYASAAAHAITHSFNNGASTTQAGNNNATSTREHYSNAWGITTGNSTADVDTVSVNATPVHSAAVLASIKAVTPTSTSVAEEKLGAPPDGTPTTQNNHKIIAHARTAAAATNTVLNCTLYQGATEITSATLTTAALTTSFAAYTLNVLDADAATITDYTNLRIRFWGTSATGDTSTVEVSQLELQTPDGTGGSVALAGTSKSASRAFATLVTGTPVNLAGASKSASTSTGEFLVLVQSIQGNSQTASQSVATLSVGPHLSGSSKGAGKSSALLSNNALLGTSSGKSKSTATLSVKQPLQGASKTSTKSVVIPTVALPLGGTSRSATKSSAILSNDLLSGVSKGGSRTTGTLTAVVALGGVSKTSSQSRVSFGALVSLSGVSRSSSKGTATIHLPVALSGTSKSKSATANAGLRTSIFLGGSSRTGSRGFASLAVHTIVALHGTSRTASRSSVVPRVAQMLVGTSSMASSSTGTLSSLDSLGGTSSTGSRSSAHLTSVIPVKLGGVSRTGTRSTLNLAVSYPLIASSATHSKSEATLSTGVVVIFEIEIGITDESRSATSLADDGRTAITMSDGG